MNLENIIRKLAEINTAAKITLPREQNRDSCAWNMIAVEDSDVINYFSEEYPAFPVHLRTHLLLRHYSSMVGSNVHAQPYLEVLDCAPLMPNVRGLVHGIDHASPNSRYVRASFDRKTDFVELSHFIASPSVGLQVARRGSITQYEFGKDNYRKNVLCSGEFKTQPALFTKGDVFAANAVISELIQDVQRYLFR